MKLEDHGPWKTCECWQPVRGTCRSGRAGTADMIRRAEKAGVPVMRVTPPGET
jgi:hypothetical protein